jgi:uncharacterized lipoprotein YmbA
MRRRALCIAILQLVDALAATACLTARSPSPRSFTIDAPQPKDPSTAGGLIVAVARVEVAPEYSGEALVYQTSDHELVRDPYARFAALPSSMLATAIRGYLANADFIGDVVSPASELPPQVTVETSAVKLAGVLRSTESSSLLTIRFRVLRNGKGTAPPTELFLKTYSATSNNPRATSRAVVDGWNRALAEIMGNFESDLRTSLVAAGLLSGGPQPTPQANRTPKGD